MRRVVLVIMALCVAACDGAPPATPGQGGPTPQAAAPTPVPNAVGGDACHLLTDQEILQVTGFEVVNREPGAQFGSNAGCVWQLDSGTLDMTWDIHLGVTSPGGRSDFQDYLEFSPDSEHIAGLGEDAVEGVANSVIALKGDTQIDLQYLGFHDGSEAIPAALVRIILTRF